jgi:hypothetical protein
VAGLRKSNAKLRRFATEELVGDLNQDACAISRIRLTTRSAAVMKVFESLETILDKLMRPVSL